MGVAQLLRNLLVLNFQLNCVNFARELILPFRTTFAVLNPMMSWFQTVLIPR